MRLTLRVKTNARKNEAKQIDAKTYQVHVTAPPVDGKANEKIVEVLADFFGKPKRCFTIVKGATSKTKIVEVDE
jgi:uncharacterized protein (TIGR00251 family)